jgi:hypothetical protein
VATRPRPNYQNQLTHARDHSLKSAALGVAHHAVVSLDFGLQSSTNDKLTISSYRKNSILTMNITNFESIKYPSFGV